MVSIVDGCAACTCLVQVQIPLRATGGVDGELHGTIWNLVSQILTLHAYTLLLDDIGGHHVPLQRRASGGFLLDRAQQARAGVVCREPAATAQPGHDSEGRRTMMAVLFTVAF